MGFLDKFRSEPAPPERPQGQSGRGHIGGFLALEEMNNDLRGVAGYAVFDKMYRTDADVRRGMAMAVNPIVQATFEVQPYGGDDATDRDREVAEAVRWALFEYMRPGFKAHLGEALPCFLRWGHAPFEQIWGVTEYKGRTILAPRKLGLRLPRTIQQYVQDEDGELTKLVQLLPFGGMVDLPARNLVYYRVGAEGDNWEGVSLLRPIYKNWYLKDKVERLDAIAQEREAVGLPVVYPPSSFEDKKVLDEMEKKLKRLRGGEQAYLLMPGPRAQDMKENAAAGWHFEMIGFGGGGGSGSSSGGGRNAQPTLQYHSDKISAGFIEEFMRIGQQGKGARATAEVQQDPFHNAVNACADIALDEMNDSIVARFTGINFDDVEGPPTVVMSEADEQAITELATFVGTLVTDGVIHPDDELEDALRKRGKLPPADPIARKARQAQEEEDRQMQVDSHEKSLEDPAPAPEKPKTARRQSREMRWWEQTMSLDTIETSIEDARARFEQAGGEAARRTARSIAEAAAEGHQPNPEPPEDLVEGLLTCMKDLYATGRRTVREELNAQGARLPLHYADEQEWAKRLRKRAELASRAVIARIAEAILQLAVGGRKAQAELQGAGEAAAAAGLRAQAQLHAAAALNQGRDDEAGAQSDQILGSRYTSILDSSTCRPCGLADDDVLRPLDDPVRISRKPPNPMCEGGDRCRCMEFFQLREESAPAR